VVEILAKKMKPHTIGDILIHPAYAAIVRTMFGTEAEQKIKTIHSSGDMWVDALATYHCY
jgi:hypothetical protein